MNDCPNILWEKHLYLALDLTASLMSSSNKNEINVLLPTYLTISEIKKMHFTRKSTVGGTIEIVELTLTLELAYKR